MVSEWWVYPFMVILGLVAVFVTYITGKRMEKRG